VSDDKNDDPYNATDGGSVRKVSREHGELNEDSVFRLLSNRYGLIECTKLPRGVPAARDSRREADDNVDFMLQEDFISYVTRKFSRPRDRP